MLEIINNGRDLLVTHIKDVDGLGCAVLTKLVSPSTGIILADIEELPLIIKRIENKGYSNIFITDLAINEELAKYISTNPHLKYAVHHFDHHKPNYDASLYPFVNSVVEIKGIKESGTSLYYKYLCDTYPNNEKLKTATMQKFVKGIQKRDTTNELEDETYKIGGNLTQLLVYYGEEEFIKVFTSKLLSGCGLFDEKEQRIIAAKETEMNNYIAECDKHLYFIKIDGLNVGVSISSMYRTELGIKLSRKYPEVDYILIVDYARECFSLRTVKNNIDLRSIALKYGGGGHTQAAGIPFKTESIPLLELVNQEIKKEIEKDKAL